MAGLALPGHPDSGVLRTLAYKLCGNRLSAQVPINTTLPPTTDRCVSVGSIYSFLVLKPSRFYLLLRAAHPTEAIMLDNRVMQDDASCGREGADHCL